MPFPQRSPLSMIATPPLLDAIYMPTQGHRATPATQVTELHRHCGRLVLQFSGEIAPWAIETIDHTEVRRSLSEEFEERYCQFSANQNSSVALSPNYDIPAKRSAALEDARFRGFKYIGLLDDDIYLSQADLLHARTLLHEGIDMVSFHVLDYPDVSTIDHIERIVTGIPSKVSIGGNCLFLDVECAKTFFPRAYNDDWFFLFAHCATSEIVSAGTARQRLYRPWKIAGRAAFEQFGDIAIEGMRSMLCEARDPFSGNRDFWQIHLSEYLSRLDRLLGASPTGKMRESLLAAQAVAQSIPIDDLLHFQRSYKESLRQKVLT